MKELWDYEDDLKAVECRFSKHLPRVHLEYALAHLRQAIRSELYDEDESPEATHRTIAQYLRLNDALASETVKGGVNGES